MTSVPSLTAPSPSTKNFYIHDNHHSGSNYLSIHNNHHSGYTHYHQNEFSTSFSIDLSHTKTITQTRKQSIISNKKW